LASSRPQRPRLTLASRSPQRRAILERLGVDFDVRPADVVELDSGEPQEVALANALSKARAVAGGDGGGGGAVLGCDTLVALDGAIHGKPADESDARDTLRALSGATHTVVSGLALLLGRRERTAIACTAVTFRVLDERLLDWYLARAEWRGRAGGYAIQGAGAALVTRVEGDYENVVGLPVAALLDLHPQLLDGLSA
jgi:septum formation protein